MQITEEKKSEARLEPISRIKYIPAKVERRTRENEPASR